MEVEKPSHTVYLHSPTEQQQLNKFFLRLGSPLAFAKQCYVVLLNYERLDSYISFLQGKLRINHTKLLAGLSIFQVNYQQNKLKSQLAFEANKNQKNF